jgi:SulP family sulfate permease
VTTLALIPEVISFSVIAGVDPKVSLIASVVLALSMSVLGGRPAMVTAAAGSVALVVAPLVKDHGVEYLLPTVLLAGLVQIAFGALGLARLARFIPRSVMVGFVNALGILIFVAQVPHLIDVPWLVYPLFALTVAIILVLPRFTKAVPAPLVAIVVVTAIVMIAHLGVPNVGDEGQIGGALPGLTPFLAPLDLSTLALIWPTALSVAFVGLMETLLTAKLVDDITETRSHKNRESWALGVANILAGFYGGIAGCAMIGQTVVNVKLARARTRISTFVAGLVLLALVTLLSDLMAAIPMVALAAVMMIVAVTTVDWHSVRPSTLRRMPVPETLVMAVTVAVVVATGNLAIGVLVGVVLAMVLFARRVAHVITVTRVVVPGAARGASAGAASTDARAGAGEAGATHARAGAGEAGATHARAEADADADADADGAGTADARAITHRAGATDARSALGPDGGVRYVVRGPLFFGSSNDLVEHFSYAADPAQVTIDFSGSQIWDASSVAALDAVVSKYRQYGIEAQIEGLDDRSSLFHGKLTGLLR